MIRTLTIFALFCGTLLGANRYVHPLGTDSGAGPIDAPWKTISYGIANMSAGDTLWLRGGTHTSDGTGNGVTMIKSGPSATQFTSIRGYPGEIALWKPTTTSYLLAVGWGTDIRSNIWIGDFAIDGINRSTALNPFISGLATWNLVITNMTMTNSSWSCITGKPNGSHYGAKGFTIVSNVIDRWGFGVDTIYEPHAIYAKAESGLVIRGNRLFNDYPTARVGSRGLHIYDVSTTPNYRMTNAVIEGNYVEVKDGAVVLGMQTDCTVRNNVFVSMGTSPAQPCVDLGYGSALRVNLQNNTIWGGNYGVRVKSLAATPTFVNNIIWGSSGSPVYIESYSPSYWTNNIARSSVAGPASSAAVLSGNLFGSSYDPQFTDAPYDMTWAPSSPARNTGANLSSLFTTDIYGTTRPQEVVFDIGAYERPAGGQLPTIRVTASGSAYELGLVPATFTFTRAESSSGDMVVNFTKTGTATAGVHYVAFSDSVVIPSGQWSVTATVTPLSVLGYVGDKTITVTLTPSAGYTITTPSSATVAIVEGNAPASNDGFRKEAPGKTWQSGRRR